MQTHNDSDIPFPQAPTPRPLTGAERRLAARAAAIPRGVLEQGSITAGRPGEQRHDVMAPNGVLVSRLPDDPDCLRISIVEIDDNEKRYVVFRGAHDRCVRLLERALEALRAAEGMPRPERL